MAASLKTKIDLSIRFARSIMEVKQRGQLKVIYLHEAPELLLPCCELLNDEWPRSLTARMRSIEGSNENLPLSLLLVDTSRLTVVGHAKISKLPNVTGASWLESVVIKKSERRKGYGRWLMNECEKVASSKGYSYAALSTADQQLFYKSLGYEECEPFNLYGLSVTDEYSKLDSQFLCKDKSLSGTCDSQSGSINVIQPSNAPPPPPFPSKQMFTVTKKTFMKKKL